jgi:hypothetical protein
MQHEITSSNPVVKAIITGTAPPTAKMAAARGMLPLPQIDLLEILAFLASGSEADLAQAARESLRNQEAESLKAAIESPDVAPSVLAYFAGQKNLSRQIYEAVVLNQKSTDDAILSLAQNVHDGAVLELVALNQQRLVRNPSIIEAILANPNRTSEAERKAKETKREFFEKERGAQQIAEELRAQGLEAAAEFIETTEIVEELAEVPTGQELSVEDVLLIASHIEVPDDEIDDSWLALDLIEEIYEETEEYRRAVAERIISEYKLEGEEAGKQVSLIRKIMEMSMKQRIKAAMKGDREVRGILIRDSNKIVAQAVISNPRITEQEIEMISAMRTVPDEVLRLIAINRVWSRTYSIIHNLARNPRTPFANAMNILPRLQTKDLKAITNNRNVAEGIRRQAGRLAATRH